MLLQCSLPLNRLSCTVFSSIQLAMIIHRLDLSKLKSLKLRYDASSPQTNVDLIVRMLQHVIECSTSLTHLDLSKFQIQINDDALQLLKGIRPGLDILIPKTAG